MAEVYGDIVNKIVVFQAVLYGLCSAVYESVL
jgi:hypothetical protein